MKTVAPTKTTDNSAAQRFARCLSAVETAPVFNPAEASALPLQRKAACSCGGGCPACQTKNSDLKVSQPNDPVEIEADHIAEKVMRMPAGEGKLATNDGRESNTLHRKENSVSPSPQPAPGIFGSSGSPLDAETRGFFEPRYGRDLGDVRVHTGGDSIQTAENISAAAFTLGNHIGFAQGAYDPVSSSGKRLLAHELAHVAQQKEPSDTGISRTIYRAPTEPPKVPPVAPPARVVYIDANVIDQINRGNTAAANALKKMLADGVEVRITQQAYNEMVVNPEIPRTATANRLVLEELGIKVGPPTSQSVRVDVYEKNITTMKSGDPVVAEGDIEVIAETKAANGEVWTFDKVVRSNPANVQKTFGVKVAPETTSIPPVAGGSKNYNVGRQLMGLRPVEISLTGEVATPSSGTQSSTPEQSGTTTTVPVDSTVSVTNTVTKSDGSVVSEIEVKFNQGLDGVNSQVPQTGEVPSVIKFRLTQNADGSFASAEPLAGEPPSLVEAIGRQIVTEAASGAEGAAVGVADGAAAGASMATKALPFVRSGLKWGGPAVFVIITGYQLITATPEQRPKVLAKAGGGLIGGVGTGFLVCNALLDLETAGWGILICGVLAGGAGGYAGSEIAGEVYDAANPPPGLTELEKALLNMDQQPKNVKLLFYSMIGKSSANGIGITPEFLEQFIYTVPPDLAVDELYTLAGQLQGVSASDSLQSILDGLSHSINQLPRRKPVTTVLPPKLNIQDIMDLDPSLRYRLDAKKPGVIKILPGMVEPPLGVPDSRDLQIAPLLEIRIPHT